jgi:hydroxymethylpyrimidine/phosphomethylpyrimidine kinase
MSNILTIAGSDPTGQAGIQADLETIRDLGHRGFSVITAVTAQNNQRVLSIGPVETRILKDQLQALFAEYEFAAIKIGLLSSQQLAYQIYRILNQKQLKNIVIDPVLKASCGSILVEGSAVPVISGFIMPLTRIATPNLDEASQLAAIKVGNPEQMRKAAKKIYDMAPGIEAVLVKGGHLKEDKQDVLYDGHESTVFQSNKIYPASSRGTGCRLSTAIACNLAEGKSITDAITRAKGYVDECYS